MDEWERQEQEREFLEIWRDMNTREKAIYKCKLTRLYNGYCINRGEFSRHAQGIEFNVILN